MGQNCFLYCLFLKTKAVLSFHTARRGSQLLTQPKWNNLQKPSAKQLTVEDSCWRALLLLMVCSCFPCGTLWNAYYQCLGSPVSYSALLPGRAMCSHYPRLCRSKALLIRWLPASCTSPWSRGWGAHRHVSHNDSSDSSTCQAEKPFKASVWGETIKCEEGSLTLWNTSLSRSLQLPMPAVGRVTGRHSDNLPPASTSPAVQDSASQNLGTTLAEPGSDTALNSFPFQKSTAPVFHAKWHHAARKQTATLPKAQQSLEPWASHHCNLYLLFPQAGKRTNALWNLATNFMAPVQLLS